jgi:ATP-dependent Clp protease, protease subunit
MAKRSGDIIEEIEHFHRFSLFVPTRTIMLQSDHNLDDGNEFGVGFSMATAFIKNMKILESISHDPITIILNTGGGDCNQGFAMYDAIQSSPCHTTIQVYGVAMSMGSILLQAGDVRLMTKNSALMIHGGEASAIGNDYETLNRAKFEFLTGQRVNNILFERLNAKRKKDNMALMSKHNFEMLVLKSIWVYAEEAVKLGLADGIIEETEVAK